MNKRTSFLESNFRAEEKNDKLYIEGYFIRFNEETELWPTFFEEIAPESVKNSLTNNDIRCLFNHDTGMVLGRSGNSTVELSADEKGLYGKVEVNQEDAEAMAVYARIKRGDINACSFGFIPIKEDYDFRDDGSTKVIVRDMDVFEVSVVTFLYPQTEVAARSKDIETMKKERLEKRKKQLKERLRNG